jgi:nitroreductase
MDWRQHLGQEETSAFRRRALTDNRKDIMNPVMENMKKRRSIRSYELKPIPREILNVLMEAAIDAPSAMNSQPWRFVVVEDAEFRMKMVKIVSPKALEIFKPLQQSDPERHKMIMQRFKELPDPIYYSAPAIIFVIGTNARAADSCNLACENIMLAAESLGLGSCYVKMGSLIADDPEIRQAFELKEDEIIIGPILVGYAKEVPAPPAKNAPAVKWI